MDETDRFRRAVVNLTKNALATPTKSHTGSTSQMKMQKPPLGGMAVGPEDNRYNSLGAEHRLASSKNQEFALGG